MSCCFRKQRTFIARKSRKRFEDNPVMVHIAFIRGHAIYKEKLGSRVILKLVSWLLFFHPSIFTFNRPLTQMRSRLLEEFLSNNNLSGFIYIAIWLKFFLQKEIYLKFSVTTQTSKTKSFKSYTKNVSMNIKK